MRPKERRRRCGLISRPRRADNERFFPGLKRVPMPSNFRVEHDFLGEKQIPADAFWGVHTARAIENFPISGTPISAMPALIRAFGCVKKAAARANAELGALDRKHAGVIILACDELIAGRLHEQFVVDVIQGGAGTSTNMNANEVIA